METKSVLVVDDEKNIRLTVAQSLKPLRLEVETASGGEEALGKLEEKSYDLVLLDLKMPEIDGIEVLKRAKRTKTAAKRVVIITAHGTIDTAIEAMKLGAVDYIQKPFSPKEIRDIVTQVLSTEYPAGEGVDDYQTLVETAKKSIIEKNYQAAAGYARKAIARDPSKAGSLQPPGSCGGALGGQEQCPEVLSHRRHYRPVVRACAKKSGTNNERVRAIDGNIHRRRFPQKTARQNQDRGNRSAKFARKKKTCEPGDEIAAFHGQGVYAWI